MFSRKQTRWMIFVIPACILMLGQVTNAQFDNSAKWVPESANAIAMVRAKKIFESEIAKKNRWKSERAQAFRSGATFLPLSTERMLIAAQMDYEYMEPIWQVTVFEKSGDAIDIIKVSEQINGNLEDIDGMGAVVLPNDAYLVQVDDKTVASMSPANRQMTSRWLRASKSGPLKLSPYLKQAVQFADANADIIVAFDFSDALSPAAIRQRLQDSKICKDEDLDGTCDSLTTLEGMTLGITINNNITGSIKLDFDGTPSILAATGKDMLIYALEKNGLMIDDFRDWTLLLKENGLQMTGELSTEGLRQIGSLIEHPMVADFIASEYAGDSGVDMKTRTLQYFNSIQVVDEELRRKQAKGLDTYAKWFDRYARQIDKLSVRNVDPVMLEYGFFVADSYRDITGMLLGKEYDRVKARAQFNDTNLGPRGAGGGGTGYNSFSHGAWGPNQGYRRWNHSVYSKNTRKRQIVSGQKRLEGANQAKEVIREIDQETAKVRKEMSQKYNTDF